MLIALSKDGGTEVTSALAAQGATRMRCSTHSARFCGATRVTSADPEGTFQALEKFGVDLTARAEEGSLDPAIRT